MITHIIFDNNGVLTTSDEELTHSKVSEFLGIAIDKIKPLYGNHVGELDKGTLSQNDFYKNVLKEGGFDLSVGDFRKAHLSGYQRKTEVQDFAKNLGKKYNLAMLSNFGDAFWSCYARWELNRIFRKKDVYVSSDMGIVKPGKEIYLAILKGLGVDSGECVFIDGRLANVRGARAVGMKAIQFKGLDSLKRGLGKLGVNGW